MTVRAVGAALLACACALAGAAVDRAGRRRLRAVESWCSALEALAGELRYRAPPLGSLLRSAGTHAGGVAGAALLALSEELARTADWDCALRLLPSLLADDALEPVRDAVALLGRCPAARQTCALDEARSQLLRSADVLRGELSVRGRVSRAAGVSVGAMLALLLW